MVTCSSELLVGQGENQHFPALALGRGQENGCHDHTPQPKKHQFPKNFIILSGKMLSVSVGHLVGWRETWGGAGLHPLQKSKAFIKNAINWYQKKTQGRLEEEAEREVGRESKEGGTRTFDH